MLKWRNEIVIFYSLCWKNKSNISIRKLVQFSRSVVSDSLRPHESQHARPPCPSPTPRVHSDSRPSSQWCHPAISSSVVPFFSCPQSLPASQSFPMSQLFTCGGQSTGVSALVSFLPKKSQGWSPSEWTGWISLQSKGLLKVFSNTTVQNHQFFGAQLSSQSNSYIHTWPLEKTIDLTRWTFVGKVMSLLFNMLSRLVMVYLPRSKCLFHGCSHHLEPEKIMYVNCTSIKKIFLTVEVGSHKVFSQNIWQLLTNRVN